MHYSKKIAIILVFLVAVIGCIPLSLADPPKPAKKRVLFVMTSHSELNGAGKKTGIWLDAVATPYYVLKDAGYDVTFSSISGLNPPIDPRSEQELTAADKRFLNDKDALQQMNDTLLVTTPNPENFSAIYFPGGHGVMWDFTDNANIKILLSAFVKDNKIIAAVDHGAIALLGVNGQNGKPLIEGRKIAAFTREEEKALHLNSIVPVYADFSLEVSGAIMVRAAPFKENAVQDGNIITGQNPESVAKVAKLMLAALKKQGN